jgi:hypothetical protein
MVQRMLGMYRTSTFLTAYVLFLRPFLVLLSYAGFEIFYSGGYEAFHVVGYIAVLSACHRLSHWFHAYFLTLKIEETCSSETSAAIHSTARRYIPEERTLYSVTFVAVSI